jgi:hypothetical protein
MSEHRSSGRYRSEPFSIAICSISSCRSSSSSSCDIRRYLFVRLSAIGTRQPPCLTCGAGGGGGGGSSRLDARVGRHWPELVTRDGVKQECRCGRTRRGDTRATAQRSSHRFDQRAATAQRRAGCMWMPRIVRARSRCLGLGLGSVALALAHRPASPRWTSRLAPTGESSRARTQ